MSYISKLRDVIRRRIDNFNLVLEVTEGGSAWVLHLEDNQLESKDMIIVMLTFEFSTDIERISAKGNDINFIDILCE